jgi:Esterase/lipase
LELVAANVAYYGTYPPDTYAAERCRLDLYRPAGADSYPTLVYFHGGGLTEGGRADGMLLAERMAAEGIGTALVDYRLSPGTTCPGYIEDAAMATAWVLKNVAEWGGATDRVFTAGHSAGAYLAAMVGLDERYLLRHGLSPRALAGVLPVSGQMVTHFLVRGERGIPPEQPIVDEFAPIFYAAVPAPPLLCIVGSDDLPSRPEENAYMIAARRAAGHADAELLVVPGRDHNSVAGHWGDPDDPVACAVLAFVRAHRAHP